VRFSDAPEVVDVDKMTAGTDMETDLQKAIQASLNDSARRAWENGL
jgi:hypothetical protein